MARHSACPSDTSPKASNTGDGDEFGFALALSTDGTTLAVSAPWESSKSAGINGDRSDGAAYSGAVYVFTQQDGAWAQQAYIKASNTEQFDTFGYAIQACPCREKT
ncbi:hypothetical protein SAMN02745121_08338 [Nannocystis exedens]|uniref:FG-GAP repeat-containing protein n=1 Tax=Nannocystis exedens TaxID=54 RepID=A0A1I2HZR6_9BACT|nr:hypothetical protein [Nannocystis exedens]PCC73537.1 hypothetical protein NAEX_06625 [Nannocystis exedens]SFF35472.1 hypothetical protein SAMN02745121_08338 [Nannocystis exedens]